MKNLNVIAAGLFSFVIAGCVAGPAVSEVNGKPIEIGTALDIGIQIYEGKRVLTYGERQVCFH